MEVLKESNLLNVKEQIQISNTPELQMEKYLKQISQPANGYILCP